MGRDGRFNPDLDGAFCDFCPSNKKLGEPIHQRVCTWTQFRAVLPAGSMLCRVIDRRLQCSEEGPRAKACSHHHEISGEDARLGFELHSGCGLKHSQGGDVEFAWAKKGPGNLLLVQHVLSLLVLITSRPPRKSPDSACSDFEPPGKYTLHQTRRDLQLLS